MIGLQKKKRTYWQDWLSVALVIRATNEKQPVKISLVFCCILVMYTSHAFMFII